MMRALCMAVLLLGACAPAPQTYRDLDRIGANFERDAMVPSAGETDQSAEPQADQDTCGLAAHQGLMGVHVDDIDAAALPARTRIIAPDTIITQDFAPGRLNIMTNVDGVVSSLRCF